VNLKLSKDQLTFEYKSDNINMFTTETLTLENRGNANAEFHFLPFRNNNQLFWMEPNHGVIKSKEKMDITFYYQPKGKNSTESDKETCMMQITDGP
jgi:hypothetical protein